MGAAGAEGLRAASGQEDRGKRDLARHKVRSNHTHFVKTSALRWVCLALLVPIPWASGVWALPFLSALAPSERYTKERAKPHKKLTPSGPGNCFCR